MHNPCVPQSHNGELLVVIVHRTVVPFHFYFEMYDEMLPSLAAGLITHRNASSGALQPFRRSVFLVCVGPSHSVGFDTAPPMPPFQCFHFYQLIGLIYSKMAG